MLGKKRSYTYIVDSLTTEKASLLHRSLAVLPEIKRLNVSASRGTVEVEATRDVEDQIKMACDIARVQFRTRVTQ